MRIIKTILLSTIIFMVLPACSQRNYDAENEILNCFYQACQEQGIDVKSKLDKIEDVFISNGVLKDRTGESYFSAFQNFSNSGSLSDNDKKIAEQLDSIGQIPSGIFCDNPLFFNEIIEKYPDSKFASLTKKMMNLTYSEIIDSPFTSFAKITIEVLDATDLENEYYRTSSLLFFASMTNISTSLSRYLPPMPQKTSETIADSTNVLFIMITEDDKILASGKEISLKELKPIARKFLLETSDKTEIDLPLLGKQMKSKGLISLNNKKGTSYEAYVSVQNEIASTINEIRDEYSLKFFGKHFNQLTEEQSKEIAKMLPFAVSEAEPGN